MDLIAIQYSLREGIDVNEIVSSYVKFQVPSTSYGKGKKLFA